MTQTEQHFVFCLLPSNSQTEHTGTKSSAPAFCVNSPSTVLLLLRTTPTPRCCWAARMSTRKLFCATPARLLTLAPTTNSPRWTTPPTTAGSPTWPCLTSPACTPRRTPPWSGRGSATSCWWLSLVTVCWRWGTVNEEPRAQRYGVWCPSSLFLTRILFKIGIFSRAVGDDSSDIAHIYTRWSKFIWMFSLTYTFDTRPKKGETWK